MLFSLALSAFLLAPAAAKTDASHAMDFLVGDWVVGLTGSSSQPYKSHVYKQANGYALVENWTQDDGHTGIAFFYYDQARNTWKQNWIDDGGWIVEKTGRPTAKGLELEGTSFEGGRPSKAKEELIRMSENRVRQILYSTPDDGKTWTVAADLTFIRKGTKG